MNTDMESALPGLTACNQRQRHAVKWHRPPSCAAKSASRCFNALCFTLILVPFAVEKSV
jgi:hypothetical protein